MIPTAGTVGIDGAVCVAWGPHEMNYNTLDQDNQSIRTYPELSRAVIAGGLSTVYRVWLILRSVDVGGSGIVGRDDARAALVAAGLTPRHLITARRVDGSEGFFTVYGNRIEYRSLECVSLAMMTAPGRSVMIPHDALGSLENFNAHLYAAFFVKADGAGRMISRDRLSELFGVSAETQRRWERLAGVDVTANMGSCAAEDLDRAAAIIPKDGRLDHLDRLGNSYTFERDGVIYWRTVNGYTSVLRAGAVGNSRKVGRRVRAGLGGDIPGAATVQSSRVFFTPKSLPKRAWFVPGHCYKADGASVYTRQRPHSPEGEFSVWSWSNLRPTTRKAALQ